MQLCDLILIIFNDSGAPGDKGISFIGLQLVDFGLSLWFVDNKNNIEYQQPCRGVDILSFP